MKRFLILLVLLGLSGGHVTAQTPYMSPQWYVYPSLINPAYTGINQEVQFNAGLRQQWAGFDGAPTFGIFQFQKGFGKKADFWDGMHNNLRVSDPDWIKRQKTPFSSRIFHGLGATLLSFESGPFDYINLGLNYGMHIRLKNDLTVSSGASFTYVNNRIDWNKIQLADPASDPLYNSLIGGAANAGALYGQLGILVHSRRFFVGVSGYLNLVENIQSNEGIFFDPIYPLISTQAGVIIPLSTLVEVAPMVQAFHNDITGIILDYGFRTNFEELFMVGMGYRDNGIAYATLGMDISSTLRINYSFEKGMAETTILNFNTHELGIQLFLKKNKERNTFLW